MDIILEKRVSQNSKLEKDTLNKNTYTNILNKITFSPFCKKILILLSKVQSQLKDFEKLEMKTDILFQEHLSCY